MAALRPPREFRGQFRDDADARDVYSEGAGIAQIVPRAVAVPIDVDDVVCLVNWAASNNVPLIPRGSGSSMSNGAIGDGVIVDVSRLNDIGAVDATRNTIRCGPGAVRNAVDAVARKSNLTFPVDPSSGAFCTIGGMASTNASGAHTLRYGSTRPWVEALDCVFSDGSRAEARRGAAAPDVEPIRRFLRHAEEFKRAEQLDPSRHTGVRKESSGYGLAAWAASDDLVDLLVGSEGTLAIIVGLELRLAPLRSATASVLGAFNSLDDAVRATATARDTGVSACELLDRTFLDVARRGAAAVPVPEETEAVLLVEIECDSRDECSRIAVALEQGFRGADATTVVLALDPETEHKMWELRHAASPILNRLDPSLKSMQLVEDGCVPPDKLADYVLGVRAALHAHDVRGVIFGHAGDAHVHVNALVDLRDHDWHDRITGLLADVTALVSRLGGTISGEHGDGRLRAPLLSRVWPAATLERFAAVKNAFDPHGLLNPGAKVPLPDAESIDRVKYDPMLPSLTAAAREALTAVERDRAYARPRFELLDEAAARLDAIARRV